MMAVEGGNLRVFISYARSDASAFAEELLCGLEVAGFEPFLDRHDIAGGEDWEVRLGKLIEAADTVIFALSPASVTSKRCAWEVERAAGLSKRLIPIVAIDVPEASIPERLRRLNFISFAGTSFARSLGELAGALRVDLNWIREHTRLGELSHRWKERSQPEELLLRGAELAGAQAWLSAWKTGAPEPTGLHRDFIARSQQAEDARQGAEQKRLAEIAASQAAKEEALKRLSRRTAFGLAGAGGLTLGAAALAWWGNDAEQRFRRERLKAEEAAAREEKRVAEARAAAIEEGIQSQAMRLDLQGQVTAYAAAADSVAMDGAPGSTNSPYTESVLSELRDRSRGMLDAVMRASTQVVEKTKGVQRPFLSTDLNADLYLLRQPQLRRRHAFCISVERYDDENSTPLQNVGKDAEAWEGFLKQAGFTVERMTNPTFADIQRKIYTFEFPPLQHSQNNWAPKASPVRRAGIVVDKTGGSVRATTSDADYPVPDAQSNTFLAVFFSGYGLSLQGEDFLTARDTRVKIGSDISLERAISVTEMRYRLRQAFPLSALVFDTNFWPLDRELSPLGASPSRDR
ncbi:MAG TPA: TIR domain-containing protein [Hyphomonadaceae bacterium]